MLHTINKSPFERSAFDSCLNHAVAGSAILMIEDGIYGALKGTEATSKVEAAAKTVSVYVLGPDLAARGMTEDQVIDGVKVVDYDGFVDLAAENGPAIQAWL